MKEKLTRSERKKKIYERFLQSETRCILASILKENCNECSHCNKTILLNGKEKWICSKKARNPLDIKGNNSFIKRLPYGDLNGKCEFFSYIVMMNEG